MQIKKFLVLVGSAITVSFLSVANLRAAESPDYLAIIASNTTNILEKVNNLPNYIEGITAYILNWQKSDDSQTTADMQVNFDTIGKAVAQNLSTQNGMQLQVIADVVGLPLSEFSTPKENPTVLRKIPQINNLSYATLLGLPPIAKGGGTAYDYIKNAAALSIKHDIPLPSWGGSADAQAKYKAYFDVVSSIESYDTYVLSGLLAEAQNGNRLTTAQNNLLTQASSSSWIAQIATEELGKVLRQILMFQSQTYVLLTQLLQTQKQQLAATTMNNSLLIINAQLVELQLSGRAKGVMSPG